MLFKKGNKFECNNFLKPGIDILEVTKINRRLKLIEFNNKGNFRKSEVENYVLIGMFKQI